MPTSESKNRDLKWLLILIISLTTVFHLGSALKGNGLFRDIHLGTALHYAQTKISLPNTVIVGFNATETPTIQELPLWQMASGLVFRTMGTRWWGWANLVSLVLFLHCLFPLFRLSRLYMEERTSYWVLIFFLSQPLTFIYAGKAATDGWCLSVAIWFLYSAIRLVHQGGWGWWLLASITASLAAVSKLPYLMAMGLAAFLFLLKDYGFSVKRIVKLSGAGIVAGIFFLLWTRYTDAAQSGAVFPYVDLRVREGTDMQFWFFGDLKYRLSAGNWIRGSYRVLAGVFGSFTLAGLVFVTWRNPKGHPVARTLIWACLLTTLVFTHLILHHWHYYLMLTPAAALLCAESWSLIETRLSNSKVLSLLGFTLLVLALFQGLMTMKIFTKDDYPSKMAELIKTHTETSDKLIIVGGGWGGEEFMRSMRNGLSAWTPHIFDKPGDLAKLKALGFNKLVMLSESPFKNAIVIVTPGQANTPRTFWSDQITPQVQAWPTLFESKDILIKSIP